ncbi:phenoloxidase 2-like [Bactrocera neohumeralis]|uniref:phenoloxidase 2-like n=1 Tax=Bactrocera neohumeralis TaxID=98809 RepID=UPI002165C3CC|nr:phenoloxidase 2-like [Bactrocera neohumeralis]
MGDKYNLLLLFDRPHEPVFMEKGRGVVFDVPKKFLTDRYRVIDNEVLERFSERAESLVNVRDISMPDLSLPSKLSRKAHFSLCVPAHRIMAAGLIDTFMSAPTVDELQSVAVYAHDRLNPYLFNYALSVAILHRKDTKGMGVPSLIQSFPNKFVDRQIFRHLREECTIVPEGSRMAILIPHDYTASEDEPEHRLWYFREDFGVNLYHWHRYLVYPFEASERSVVYKVRRGELFYYMYQQILARYNVERLGNDLKRVEPLIDLREYIKEGYFPKMESAPRFDNTKLSDVRRHQDQLIMDIEDLEQWSERIKEAITKGFVLDESEKHIPLNIDVLGNIVESSKASPNRNLYGDLHNMGHLFIAYAHDPSHRHLESFGVVGDLATAMRDPAFYRWHAYLDSIFQQHKAQLPPYTNAELRHDGFSLTSVEVIAENVREPNVLQTFWQESDIDLSRGMDFAPRGNIFARFKHLQHAPFTYTIKATNECATKRFGLVRIFLGPKYDEQDQTMTFNEQRLLMIELDKFVIALQPGENVIRRRSTESSLTIPVERTFRELEVTRVTNETMQNACGWPHHMLIPKGSTNGLQCELVVMVTNYDQESVDEEPISGADSCSNRHLLQHDHRALGFPFDRQSRLGADRLADFLTPNMIAADVVLRHVDRTEHCC